MSRKYKALLMDVDGTLLDFDQAEAEAFVKVLTKYGIAPKKDYVEDYHRINQECWEEFEAGRMERDQVLTVRFDRFFQRHGFSVSGEEAESQKPQKEFFDYCFANIPDIKPEEMIIIGDSLTSDIQGGINAGIDTCWFNPQGNENRKLLPVTKEIRRLSELKIFL